jgi:hypothetical protein
MQAKDFLESELTRDEFSVGKKAKREVLAMTAQADSPTTVAAPLQLLPSIQPLPEAHCANSMMYLPADTAVLRPQPIKAVDRDLDEYDMHLISRAHLPAKMEHFMAKHDRRLHTRDRGLSRKATVATRAARRVARREHERMQEWHAAKEEREAFHEGFNGVHELESISEIPPIQKGNEKTRQCIKEHCLKTRLRMRRDAASQRCFAPDDPVETAALEPPSSLEELAVPKSIKVAKKKKKVKWTNIRLVEANKEEEATDIYAKASLLEKVLKQNFKRAARRCKIKDNSLTAKSWAKYRSQRKDAIEEHEKGLLDEDGEAEEDEKPRGATSRVMRPPVKAKGRERARRSRQLMACAAQSLMWL